MMASQTREEFEAAGLYDPASPKAAERLELLEWLAGQGVTIPEMQNANAHGGLMYAASRHALRAPAMLTQKQLADRLGITVDLVEAFRIAFALPPPAPGEPWCNEAEAELFREVGGGIALFGEKGMLRLSRVLGSSVTRVAEAMVMANQERMRRMLGADSTELEVGQVNLQATQTAEAPGKIMQALLGLHVQIAVTRVRERRSSLADETVYGCVGFADLVGSTTLSRQLSAKELADVVDRFEEVANDVAVNRGGRIIKFIGDEVMFVTGDAASACDIALTLIESFAGDPAITPRAGLAAGQLLDRGGDYYGPVVNLAARLAEQALPREVLISTDIESACGPNLRFETAGRRLLRGFDVPVRLMTVSRD